PRERARSVRPSARRVGALAYAFLIAGFGRRAILAVARLLQESTHAPPAGRGTALLFVSRDRNRPRARAPVLPRPDPRRDPHDRERRLQGRGSRRDRRRRSRDRAVSGPSLALAGLAPAGALRGLPRSGVCAPRGDRVLGALVPRGAGTPRRRGARARAQR